MNKRDECEFDKNGICYAGVCYSNKKCNAKDKKGNPKYCSNEEV